MEQTPIRKRLEILGKSQWRLAQDLGLHPSYVNRLVAGETIPNARRALLIAQELDSTVEELWGVAP